MLLPLLGGLKLPAMAPHMACVCNKQQQQQRQQKQRQQLAKFLGNFLAARAVAVAFCALAKIPASIYFQHAFSSQGVFPFSSLCVSVCVLCSLNDMAHAHDPSGGVCTAGVGFLWAASGRGSGSGSGRARRNVSRSWGGERRRGKLRQGGSTSSSTAA